MLQIRLSEECHMTWSYSVYYRLGCHMTCSYGCHFGSIAVSSTVMIHVTRVHDVEYPLPLSRNAPGEGGGLHLSCEDQVRCEPLFVLCVYVLHAWDGVWVQTN